MQTLLRQLGWLRRSPGSRFRAWPGTSLEIGYPEPVWPGKFRVSDRGCNAWSLGWGREKSFGTWRVTMDFAAVVEDWRFRIRSALCVSLVLLIDSLRLVFFVLLWSPFLGIRVLRLGENSNFWKGGNGNPRERESWRRKELEQNSTRVYARDTTR